MKLSEAIMPELYVLRHGAAEPRSAGKPDEERALTPDGRSNLSRVLARARRSGVAPGVILTSPLRRAVETAGMAAAALSPKAEPIRSDSLRPEGSPARIWKEVRRYSGRGPVLVVGHEPLLGEFLSFLVGVRRGIVDLKKGAMACVQVDAAGGRPQGLLEWLLTPRICRNAGKRG